MTHSCQGKPYHVSTSHKYIGETQKILLADEQAFGQSLSARTSARETRGLTTLCRIPNAKMPDGSFVNAAKNIILVANIYKEQGTRKILNCSSGFVPDIQHVQKEFIANQYLLENMMYLRATD
jgi:hypothetical protein